MAYPGSPPKGPAPFEKAPPTPDDLERLATAFRPSWELDDAPFTGAGVLSAGDIRALQGGGTHADIRAATLNASHASHSPAKPSLALDEPATKVIVDPALVTPLASARPAAERLNAVSSAGPWAASTAMPPIAQSRPPAPDTNGTPSTQRITSRPGPRPAFPTDPSIGSSGSKKTGLWVGAAGAAVALIGGVMWLASGSPDKPVPAPSITVTAAERAQPSIPPPPAEPLATNATPPPGLRPMPAPPVIAATALPSAPWQAPAAGQPAVHASMG